MNKNTTIIVAIIAAAIGFFVYSQSTMAPAVVEQSNTVAVVEKSDTIDIEAGAFYYKPNVITVKKGEKVTLKLKAVDMMHDFNIDALSVKIPIVKSGEEAMVEFTPTQVGEFEFYCSVGQHRKNGQVGKLIVTE